MTTQYLPERAVDGLRGQPRDQNLIDPAAFARYHLKHWVLPTAALTLSIALGAFYYVFAAPIYRAQVTLLYQSIQQQDEGSNLSLSSGLALLGLQGARANPERAKAFGLLKSSAFLLPFIRRMNLAPDLYARRYNSARALLPNHKAPTGNELHERFIKSVMSVDDDTTTGLITLSIFLPAPQEASVVANTLIDDLNEALRNDAVSQAQANIDYLDKQLASTQISELRNAIAQLVQSEMRRLLLASGRTSRSFAIIDPASPPDRPYAPRPVLIAAMSVLLGLVLGGVINLFRFLRARAVFV